ncbi:MAG: hypothetical protein GY931_11495 [Maribacter sp.]|nr:hypothetical protein [Maribacter sp.]
MQDKTEEQYKQDYKEMGELLGYDYLIRLLIDHNCRVIVLAEVIGDYLQTKLDIEKNKEDLKKEGYKI